MSGLRRKSRRGVRSVKRGSGMERLAQEWYAKEALDVLRGIYQKPETKRVLAIAFGLCGDSEKLR